MTRARRVTPAYASADFSYRQSRLTGDRWMLAGDAAGFIDPVFSSGVFLALLAGEQCADILNIVLDHPRKAPRLFAKYERLLRRVMKGYLRFVDAWYSKEFIEVFLYPQDVLQIPPAVNAVLGGNISGSFAHPLAHVGLLFHRLAATLPAALPAPHARRTQRRETRAALRSLTTCMHRSVRCLRRPAARPFFFSSLCLTSCQTLRHQFASARARLAIAESASCNIAGRRISLIGDVLVRYSKQGRLRVDLQQRPGRDAPDGAAGRQVRPRERSPRPRLVVGPA